MFYDIFIAVALGLSVLLGALNIVLSVLLARASVATQQMVRAIFEEMVSAKELAHKEGEIVDNRLRKVETAVREIIKREFGV